VKIKEKVAYLQGLTNGMDINGETREGRLLLNVVDLLDDMAVVIDEVRSQQDDLELYVESIDEDLTVLEDDFYDIDNIEEDDDDYDVDEEGIDFVEVECPSCHETVHFEKNLLHDDESIEITCPNCSGIVYDSELNNPDYLTDERVEARHPGL
jgi:ribosomal protein S27E